MALSGTGSGRGLEFLVCPPDDLEAALGILYRRSSGFVRAGLIAEAIDEFDRGDLDLAGLWIARRRGRLIGAMLTQGLAGRAAAFWAPEVTLTLGASTIASELVEAALHDFRRRGFRIAQALVDASSPARAARDLARGGLPRVTDLIYMARDTFGPLSGPDRLAPPPFRWRPYNDATAAHFGRVLQQTYIGSLDMPELDGVRSLDDVLASHQAGGRFVPDLWQLGTLDDEPEASAVLLLAESPDRPARELAYLGLTPAARGRGLGRAALARALELSRSFASRLELAVDIRNLPADRLYRSAGFEPYDRRSVHLATLTGPE